MSPYLPGRCCPQTPPVKGDATRIRTQTGALPLGVTRGALGAWRGRRTQRPADSVGPAAPWNRWAYWGAWGRRSLGPGGRRKRTGAADQETGRFKAAGWDTRLSPKHCTVRSEGPPTRPSAKLRSPGAGWTPESSRDSGRVASQTRCRLQPELTRVSRPHPQCGVDRLVFSP